MTSILDELLAATGAPPSGTGFRHVTGGTEDTAARPVLPTDITPSSIDTQVLTTVSGSVAWSNASGGVSLSSTTPTAIGASSVLGTGTTAAKADHTHAGVATVNSLTGALTLAAGPNMTITPSGNTLTFQSAGTSPPTGTGFPHITAGAYDASARVLALGDLPAGTNGNWLTTSGGAAAWASLPANVSSLNSLTGGLSLVAGTNVTLGVGSTTITINASGGSPPSGTGFPHITGGAYDASARVLALTDLPASGTNGWYLTTTGGVAAWSALPSNVSSLNSLTGALSIAAGSNITVTPSGSNVTIASTATQWQLAKVNIAFPASGSTDTVVYTFPSGGTSGVIAMVAFRINTTLVGGGSCTVIAGSTAGGNNYLLSTSLSSSNSSATNHLYGLDSSSEEGSLISAATTTGYAIAVGASQTVNFRLTASGTVTGGSIDAYVFGFTL